MFRKDSVHYRNSQNYLRHDPERLGSLPYPPRAILDMTRKDSAHPKTRLKMTRKDPVNYRARNRLHMTRKDSVRYPGLYRRVIGLLRISDRVCGREALRVMSKGHLT
ncbi:hypothetical protein RRG08_009566 [Elysia crispata]|uniref:Uncharacterized protein n=1 Tax=Elysia crispata TaxID=231223 RepID=A0AAE0ZHD0_9GAST|nr:hypothetical protein RRG08_009566 [Elysia crispata]